MNILYNILTNLICGGLDSWGGYNFIAARRFIMPSVLSLRVWMVTGQWWTMILIWPMMATLTLKYFNGDNAGRAEWVWLQAVVGGLGLTIAWHTVGGHHIHYLVWWVYVGYIALAGVLGGLYKNWKQWKGDLAVGAYLCSIPWLIWLSAHIQGV
jgi:hypothetical protein